MERPFQEIGWNTAMVTIPVHHRSTTERARSLAHTRRSWPSMSVRASIAIDGHKHAVLLAPHRCAAPPTWPGAVSAMPRDPRQAERYLYFTALITALVEAEDGSGRVS